MLKNKREIGFDVDAYTARLIGRENVSKLEGALLELVKNAYDADASVVYIYYDDYSKELLIMDNGEGMTEDVIRQYWMTIGNSSKKDIYFSGNRRIKTGAKGIGRFALDRISDHCRMWTSTGEETLEWEVSWNQFAGNRKISDVKASLYDSDDALLSFAQTENWGNQPMAKQVNSSISPLSTGTVFCLTGLHDDWTEKVQEKIRRNLANLLPPDVVDDFKIYFFNSDTPLDEAEIQSNNVDQFDYRITFQVLPDTETGPSTVLIHLLRNEFDLIGKVDLKAVGFSDEDRKYFLGCEKNVEVVLKNIVSQPEGKNLIGGFEGTLYFSKVTTTDKDRQKYFYKDFSGRKNFTKEFGGIKVYRDHFRVRPYGEYGDNDFDWLELSARRNKQPAAISHKTGRWRVGSEQLMGVVNISRLNTNLEDDANRNGLQDGPGLHQLKEILIAVIDEFERDRQYVGRILAAYHDSQKKLQQELERLAWMAEQRKKWEEEEKSRREKEQSGGTNKPEPPGPVDPDLTVNPIHAKRIIDELQEEQEQEIEALKDELKMLRTLATTGIITNMFMHEIRTLTNNIGIELDSAYEALLLDNDPDYAVQQIVSAVNSKKHFNSWFGITIGAIKKDKRKRRVCNVAEILDEFITDWKRILKKSRIELEVICQPNLNLRCFAFDLENIFSNLISNSVSSFEREGEAPLKEKKISIHISGTEDGLRIDYADTGRGLQGEYKKHPERTLEAFETDKKSISGLLDSDGTGMGMWIVNQIVQDYQGSVNLEANKTLARGYQAIIMLGGTDLGNGA